MPTLNLSPNLVTANNYRIFPDGPYLLASLVVSIVATAKSFSALTLGVSTPLVQGVDYFPAFLFNQATGEQGQPVYGGIYFVDPALEGTLTYSFTDVGVDFQASTLDINAAYADDALNPLVAWWEHVVPDLPIYAHPTLVYDATIPTGIDAVLDSMDDLVTEVVASTNQKSIFDFTAHIANTDNPHNDTADAVGLGKVPNWSTGSAANVIAGGSGTQFSTPLSIKDSVATVMPTATVARKGVLELNQGTSPGDPTNATDGLTAAGLVYMLDNSLLDSNVTLVNNQRQKVSFSPFPIVYPATWNGVECNTFEELVQAVQTSSGLSELTANAKEGAIYFPRSATAPSLVLS